MFERIKERYQKGYVRKDQLKRYVELGVITPMQYKEICGDECYEG